MHFSYEDEACQNSRWSRIVSCRDLHRVVDVWILIHNETMRRKRVADEYGIPARWRMVGADWVVIRSVMVGDVWIKGN